MIGGIAVNLHGYNRLTGDLDIIISLTHENVLKFVSAVKELGLVPRLPVKVEDFADEKLRSNWVREKSLKVFTVHNPANLLEHVDVKIDAVERIEQYLRNAVVFKAGDINISVVTVDDLIALKREAARDRDLIDIKALERIRRLDDYRGV